MSVVIAVDGVAASGKGTIARAVARHHGFAYLDTGALYRRVAEAVLRHGHDCHDAAAAIAAAQALDMSVPDAALRTAAVGQGASVVAAHPGVRAALLEAQRAFAARPPGGEPGAVLDGRDIGTVVCPDAPAKLFVTARLDVRARRRWSELQAQGSPLTPEQVAAEIAARDARDSGRAAAPLKPAPDAVLLDTSDLTIEAAVAAALEAVRTRIGR